MINTSSTAPAAQQDPALLRDITALVSTWDPSLPVSDLVAVLNDRSNLAAPAAVPRKRKRGKCMSQRRGQKVKIEPHGGNYTFRARVDVKGQEKRVFRRIIVSPIDPAAPGWLNASECYRKAGKMMAALEGRNEEIVEGDAKVLVNPIDVNPTGVVPVEIAPTKPCVPTFAEQAKIFMKSAVQARSTKKGRRSYLDNWLLPMLADFPLDKITNKKVQELVAWMKKGGPMPGERE